MKINLRPFGFCMLLAPLAFTLACSGPLSSTVTVAQDDDNGRLDKDTQVEIATFGGGCFWCTEAVFEAIKGVKSVKSGYTGGEIENPTYDQVCSGQTGHAEVIQIEFDPSIVSFSKLLEVHLKTHDPTTLNRQGADIGTQYRSAVFYHNEDQRTLTADIIKKLNAAQVYQNPIVTEVAKFTVMYDAEKHHQNYFADNPNQGYCRAVIQPKMKKFKKVFGDLLKD